MQKQKWKFNTPLMSRFEELLKEQNLSVEEAVKNKQWIDGNVKVHTIKDMDTSYLHHALEFVVYGYYNVGKAHKIHLPECVSKFKDEYINLFRKELMKRKD